MRREAWHSWASSVFSLDGIGAGILLQNILIQVLIGFSVLLLLCTIVLWFWRQMVEFRMRDALGSSGNKVRAVASEKTQVLSFLEQQKLARVSKQMMAGKLREGIAQRHQEIKEARERNFYVLHQLGEPAKDKEEFGATLLINGAGDHGLSPALVGVDHLCVIWADSDATARRQLDMQFNDKGAFRPSSFHRRGA